MNNIKKIFTILIVIILSERTYSQQKEGSKILSFLSKELKDNKLYFEPMDSITKKFKTNIVAHEKNVTFSEVRRIQDMRPHQTTFEDLINVVPGNLALFDNRYKVDTISFYFNNKRLIMCWYQFKLPINGYRVSEKAVDTLYKMLNQGFDLGGEAGETNIADYDGYAWRDEYTDVNFLTSHPFAKDPDLKEAYLSIEMFKPAEANILLEKQTAQIKTNRSGKGNSTFNLSISILENLISDHATLKMLELQFGSWNSDGNSNYVTYEYDEKTQEHTLPLFEVYYNVKIKTKYYQIKAEVSKTLNNPIRLLEFTTDFSGMQLAEFKESLREHRYLLNETTTDLFNKLDIGPTKYLDYSKRAGKTDISIKWTTGDEYTITIMK
jgi:hypothetical protein